MSIVRRTMHGDCDCGADPADPCAVCARGRFRAKPGCPNFDCGRGNAAEPPLPPMAVRVVRFAGATVRDVAVGMPRRSADEQARIIAICEGCESFRQSDRTCARCGCPIARKSPMEREHCPVGRW